jgi:hypothetical protein
LHRGLVYRGGQVIGVDWTVARGTFSKKRKEKRHLGFKLYPYTLGVNWIIIFYASRLKIQLFKKNLPKIMGGGGGKHIVLPPLYTHPHPPLPKVKPALLSTPLQTIIIYLYKEQPHFSIH